VASVAYAGVEAAVDFVREEAGVWVDCVEVAGAFDQVFLFLRKVGEQVAERRFERRWVVAVCPWAAEPADAEIKVALSCFFVTGRGAVSLVIVPTVLECNSMRSLELLVIPLRDLSMCQQRMMAA
jgi:hypothetical protein